MVEQNTAINQQTRRGIWVTVISILVVISLFMGLFLHKVLSPSILSPVELRANGAVVFDQPRMIRDFVLLDHNQQRFDLSRFVGNWTLVYFGFTQCPDICPATLAQINELLQHLDTATKERLQVVLVSVDPARDTPERLAAYVTHFNPDFIGVTGEFLQIMQLTQDVNVAFSKVMLGDDYTIDHTGHLVLLNPKGHYHGFFKAPFELSRLKLTLRSIIASAKL